MTAEGVFGNLTSYGDPGFSRFVRRAFFSGAGYDAEDLERPVVGIVDTRCDYTPCHRDMPALIEAVKRGVSQAGGLPLVCPTMSLGETIISPTAMLFRNLLAMETEELIRSYPMDAVVLLGGCDKTLPAQMMAATSANLPAVHVVVGPMRSGHWQGERVGACTDCRRLWLRHRAGDVGKPALEEAEANVCPTGGTCMVMGTASTMACLAEVLGVMLPGGATPPSGSGDRLRNAVASGRAAVQLIESQVRPRDVLTDIAFRNALAVLVSLGGSTNAIIHLIAVARRAGIAIDLDTLQEISRDVPLLVNCRPSGEYWLEDVHRAGGLAVLLKTLAPHLDLSARNILGQSLDERLADVDEPASWQDVIFPLSRPLGPPRSLRVVRGSLAPNGAIIKMSAASSEFAQHRGPAVVFDSPEDVAARIDDERLGITPQHVMVLRNAGPVAAGMPEAGSIPIPAYLAREGVTDMVRVSDARMSGTAYGTVVLHCAPEAAVGGPIGLVRDGDPIVLDLEAGTIDLDVDPEELDRRRADYSKPELPERGWRRLYAQHVLQADEGADLDFLVPPST